MEKAILVGVQLPDTNMREVNDSMAELARLAETAGYLPEIKIIQKRAKLDPGLFIGKGKALEISEMAAQSGIKFVLFDEDLKPAQNKNLSELMKLNVVDRTRLILDIFARRARTKEGKLQVELAEFNYLLPRLTEKFGTFEQQTGGVGRMGGISRGPGERKLEVDQRIIKDRISDLNKEIEIIRKKRQILRHNRIESGLPTVAIVGYTNAGKSTLLNTLSKKSPVYADDKLFATLDPTTHKVELPGGRDVLFTDTVGFIKKLPHGLVAAFRATLEEITHSHCILHLVDASSGDYEKQMETTMDVLKELEATNIPIVTVYNKADLLSAIQMKRLKRDNAFLVSAKTGKGLKKMLEHIEKIVVPKVELHKFVLSFPKNDFLGKIYRLSVVKKQKYTEKGIELEIKCSSQQWNIIKEMISE
jgi:GTP-binding protein HflX